MFKSMRLWFMLLIIVGGLGIAACGSDDKDDKDKDPTATAAAGVTPADGDSTPVDGGNTPDDSGNGGGDGNGDGALGDIPVPDGASEVDSGTFSGGQFPVVDPSGEIDASAYGDIEFKTYETSDSAESVVDFYSGELSGWDEVYKFSSSGVAIGIWTRDDGNQALWVSAAEAEGTTTVAAWVGSTD
ncbi:MAG: hypothetical protein WEB04_12235 [Dehalococcoidia bacterium]